MDDVNREAEWQANLRAAAQEPAGPVGVGTIKRYRSVFLKREVQNSYRVVAYELYVRVVYETTPDSAVRATVEVRWDQVSEGTRVTMVVDAAPGGPLKMVPAKVLAKASTDGLENMLAALRLRLETG